MGVALGLASVSRCRTVRQPTIIRVWSLGGGAGCAFRWPDHAPGAGGGLAHECNRPDVKPPAHSQLQYGLSSEGWWGCWSFYSGPERALGFALVNVI